MHLSAHQAGPSTRPGQASCTGSSHLFVYFLRTTAHAGASGIGVDLVRRYLVSRLTESRSTRYLSRAADIFSCSLSVALEAPTERLPRLEVPTHIRQPAIVNSLHLEPCACLYSAIGRKQEVTSKTSPDSASIILHSDLRLVNRGVFYTVKKQRF